MAARRLRRPLVTGRCSCEGPCGPEPTDICNLTTAVGELRPVVLSDSRISDQPLLRLFSLARASSRSHRTCWRRHRHLRRPRFRCFNDTPARLRLPVCPLSSSHFCAGQLFSPLHGGSYPSRQRQRQSPQLVREARAQRWPLFAQITIDSQATWQQDEEKTRRKHQCTKPRGPDRPRRPHALNTTPATPPTPTSALPSLAPSELALRRLEDRVELGGEHDVALDL